MPRCGPPTAADRADGTARLPPRGGSQADARTWPSASTAPSGPSTTIAHFAPDVLAVADRRCGRGRRSSDAAADELHVILVRGGRRGLARPSARRAGAGRRSEAACSGHRRSLRRRARRPAGERAGRCGDPDRGRLAARWRADAGALGRPGRYPRCTCRGPRPHLAQGGPRERTPMPVRGPAVPRRGRTARRARLAADEWPRLAAAADLRGRGPRPRRATSTPSGAGHSHMLAEELFYRAGGLVRVRPILFEGLMLHASAHAVEHAPRAPAGPRGGPPRGPPDGRRRRAASSPRTRAATRSTTELATLARDRGVPVIAITSLQPRHESAAARTAGGSRLARAGRCRRSTTAGTVGDAAVAIDGLRAAGRPHLDRRGRCDRSTRSSRRSSNGWSPGASHPRCMPAATSTGGDAVERHGLLSGATEASGRRDRVAVRHPGRHRGLLRQPLDPRGSGSTSSGSSPRGA